MYFLNESTEEEFMLIFDPIIDIKRKDNSFTVFYYPDSIFTIVLKDENVEKSSQKQKINESKYL